MARHRANKHHGEALAIPDPHDPDSWDPKDAYPPATHKYGAKKATVDGHTFPSRLEARRYMELRLLEDAGEIYDLELQPRYRIEINGFKVCEVVPDFRFKMPDGAICLEDTKGRVTPEAKLKRKLLQAAHGIDVRFVFASEVYPFNV